MKPTVLVLGSGPIRIGQGIEFDYSCVHCVWSLREMGYRAIIVNNNPETVSTDFDTGDGLYFEPVTLDDVLDIISHESPIGVVCQFGGQTAINLAQGLRENGVQVLGTSPESIAMAEDREQFDNLLSSLDIPRPRGKAVRSFQEAKEVASEVGYPVLVRPSFVLGGRAMEIVFNEGQLQGFYKEAEDANPDQPVLVDKYLLGKEAEVDVISDGVSTLVPGIMEHIERAGVHSGDSMAVYPAISLSEEVQAQIVTSACNIARALQVKGLMNIQFVIAPEDPRNPESPMVAYVLEVNPRASRTVPYLSKVTGVPMVDLATRCMMGSKLEEMGYESGLWIIGEEPAGRPVSAPPQVVDAEPEPAAQPEPDVAPDFEMAPEPALTVVVDLPSTSEPEPVTNYLPDPTAAAELPSAPPITEQKPVSGWRAKFPWGRQEQAKPSEPEPVNPAPSYNPEPELPMSERFGAPLAPPQPPQVEEVPPEPEPEPEAPMAQPVEEVLGGEAACALPEVAEQFGLLTRNPGTNIAGWILPEAEFIHGAPSLPTPKVFAIKAPVFSFQKLGRVEPSLGPEMKSTGEILGIDNTFEGALYKALVASGIQFKGDGKVLITVRNDDKAAAIAIARQLRQSGREIAATPGTARVLQDNGIACEMVNKIQEGSPNILDAIMDGRVSLMINTPSLNETSESEGARIRRACIETGVPCVTSIDTASALIRALDVFRDPMSAQCLRLEEYFQTEKPTTRA